MLSALLLLLACGDGDAGIDGGTVDAANDTETADVGAAGVAEDPETDASDAAEPDAGMTDATIDTETMGEMPIVVALGWQGLRLLSIDEGQTWCQTGLMEDGHDDLFRGGFYGGEGIFVGAHAGRENHGAIIISENGYEWTALHRTNEEPDLPVNPSGQWYGGVAYGNGTWLAAGGCGRLASSSDGLTWTSVPSFTESCLHIRSLVFAGDRFVAALNDGTWWRSDDGTGWELEASDQDSSLVWDGSELVGGGPKKWLDRGLCLWGAGSPVRHLYRSENADCSDPVDVYEPANAVTTVLYGYAPTEDFEGAALPDELRTCLGL